MTDRDVLLAALDAEPWATMRALGDEAEEAGDQWLAAGWRWLARWRKYPACEGGDWGWADAGNWGGLPSFRMPGPALPKAVCVRAAALMPRVIGTPDGRAREPSVALHAMARAVAEYLRDHPGEADQ